MSASCLSIQPKRPLSWRGCGTVLAVLLVLGGCGTRVAVPEWQVNAHGAVERATQAELEGNSRVARLEWDRARREAARTADATWVGRVALTECAIRQTALDLAPCEAFLAVEADAATADLAYHRWLLARPLADDTPALPSAYRPWVQAWPLTEGEDTAGRLAAMNDPVARLIAASVLFRVQRLDAAGVRLAVDTASVHGWRRPLLAWLRVQHQVAKQSGDSVLRDAVQRRLDLLNGAR